MTFASKNDQEQQNPNGREKSTAMLHYVEQQKNQTAL